MDELNRYFSEEARDRVLGNICSVLGCRESDIGDIYVISGGLTNMSFHFTCCGCQYVYRHPGPGTEKIISRESEAFSAGVAKELGLDSTTVHIDSKEGWKISRFIPNARCLNYHDPVEVSQALSMIRTLHSAAVHSDFDFDIWKRTLRQIELTAPFHSSYDGFEELKSSMTRLYTYTKGDCVPWVLCHCDCYDPNFLLDSNGNMTLIDWEYSGNDDPANDLGSFICCSDYGYDEALEILNIYYGREPSFEELRHNIAYVAIASYYWYIWAIYQCSVGNSPGEYLKLWHDNAELYMEKALKMYEGGQFE